MTSRLSSAITDHLLMHGPATAEDLHAALVATGTTNAKTPTSVRNALRQLPTTFQLADDRWDLTTRVLTGVTLTIRPRSRLRENVLWVHDDLAPFDGLLPSGSLTLSRGGVVRRGGSEIRTMIGPEGWLPKISSGGLIGLRWCRDALDVVAVEPHELPDPAALDSLRDLLCLHRDSLSKHYHQRTTVADILLSALREAPDMFRKPLPPLSELFPLPPQELHDTMPWELEGPGERLTLHLPTRVYGELCRRAEMLGEPVPTHAAILLGAALDRALPVPIPDFRYSPAYDDIYPSWEDDDVVRQLRRSP